MKRRDFLRTAGGGAGVAAASTAAPSAAAQEGGGQTTVDMTDGLVFDPAEVTIPPDTTVVWENVGSSGHTVTAYEEEIPGEAEYFASGGFDAEQSARDGYFADQSGDIPGGESYEHTFTVTGEYGYFCIPHESAGMVGTITVEEGASLPGAGGGEGGGEVDPEHMGVPIQAHFVGLATVLMVFVSLVFTFFLLKYGESPHASGGNQ